MMIGGYSFVAHPFSMIWLVHHPITWNSEEFYYMILSHSIVRINWYNKYWLLSFVMAGTNHQANHYVIDG